MKTGCRGLGKGYEIIILKDMNLLLVIVMTFYGIYNGYFNEIKILF